MSIDKIFKSKLIKINWRSSIPVKNRQFQHNLNVLYHSLYTLKDNYIDKNHKILIHCNRCGHYWKTCSGSFFSNIHVYHTRLRGCKYCYSRITIPQLQNKLNHLYPKRFKIINTQNKLVNSLTKITVLCNVCHHASTMMENDLVRQDATHIKAPCHYCNWHRLSLQRSKTTAQFKREVRKYHGNDIKVIGKYKTNTTPIKLECNHCHNTWSTKPIYIIGDDASGCPFCNLSSGERMIDDYLKRHGLIKSQSRSYYTINGDYIRACYNVPWLNGLHLDFWIPSLNRAIEMDGIQHFKPTKFGNESKVDATRSYQRQHYNDQLKNKLCKAHHVQLIRIKNIHNLRRGKLFKLICKTLNKYKWTSLSKWHRPLQLDLF